MRNELIKIEGQSGITATGWDLTNITEGQWKEAGNILVQVDQARQWWLGDWYNAHKWGDAKTACNEVDGIRYESAKDCGWVASGFELSRRRDILSFSHHREVLPLETDMQDKFLDLAELEVWTVSFTRQKVQAYLAMSDWSESERQRRFDIEAGKTVVANINKDGDVNLVNWAKQEGVYSFIGRSQFDIGWGNPYELDDDGDRDQVCDAHKTYFNLKYGLHPKVKSLKGKVLGCYCYPERCHGDFLAELANGNWDMRHQE